MYDSLVPIVAKFNTLSLRYLTPSIVNPSSISVARALTGCERSLLQAPPALRGAAWRWGRNGLPPVLPPPSPPLPSSPLLPAPRFPSVAILAPRSATVSFSSVYHLIYRSCDPSAAGRQGDPVGAGTAVVVGRGLRCKHCLHRYSFFSARERSDYRLVACAALPVEGAKRLPVSRFRCLARGKVRSDYRLVAFAALPKLHAGRQRDPLAEALHEEESSSAISPHRSASRLRCHSFWVRQPGRAQHRRLLLLLRGPPLEADFLAVERP